MVDTLPDLKDMELTSNAFDTLLNNEPKCLIFPKRLLDIHSHQKRKPLNDKSRQHFCYRDLIKLNWMAC